MFIITLLVSEENGGCHVQGVVVVLAEGGTDGGPAVQQTPSTHHSPANK